MTPRRLPAQAVQLPPGAPAPQDHVHPRAYPGSVDAAAIIDGVITPTEFDASVYAVVGSITAIDPDDAAAAGVAPTVARGDHQHAFTSGAASALARTSSSSEGSSSSHARADHGHSTANLAWGILNPGRFSATADSTGYTSDTTTDFAIASVVVDSTRLYEVSLRSQWLLDAAGVWNINFHVGGTLTETMWAIDTTVAHRDTLFTTILWEPTSGTKNVDIRVDEIAGTSTLTFEAGATNPRRFWIKDIGPR